MIAEAVTRCGAESVYVRVTVSRGEGGEGIGTKGCDRPLLSIIARPFAGYPLEAYRDGIDSTVVETRKIPPACVVGKLKSGNYLPNILARREMEAEGLIEGIQLAVDGRVCCGTVSNVFFRVGGELVTPDEGSGCRLGVTRAIFIELSRESGLRTIERSISREELDTVEEGFFANTLMECLPIRRLSGRLLRSAEKESMTRALHAAYRGRVQREVASTKPRADRRYASDARSGSA